MPQEVPPVVVATLSAGLLCHEFSSSWSTMLAYDAASTGYTLVPGGKIEMCAGPRIAETRSQIVDAFFADPQFEGAQWLLMIDSDMVFDMHLLERMMAVADPVHRPVLGALCFAGGRSMSPYPTIYEEVLSPEADGKPTFVGIRPVKDYPRDALVRVGATGGACLLVHRNVLAAMTAPWPQGFGTHQDGSKNPYPWFVEGLMTPDGEPIGEDIAFCRRLALLQVPIHVHTGIKAGHVKTYVLDEKVFDFHQALTAEQTVVTESPVVESPAKVHGDGPNRAERRRRAREGLKVGAS